MKKINSYQKYIMVILIMLLLITTFVGIKYLMQDSKSLSKTNEINNQKKFAIMVQTEDGYEEYVSEDNTWPGEGYDFKEAKCVDNKGNEVNSIVTYNDGKVTLKTNKTVFCTLYFDMEKTYSLTIHYWLERVGGDVAAPDCNRRYKVGEEYFVASPIKPGYVVDVKTINGIMPSNDLVFDVIYAPIKYTLTIDYVYLDGTTATPSHIESLAYGETYNVVSPPIDGFTPNPPIVTGTMPNRNIIVKVIYINNYSVEF